MHTGLGQPKAQEREAAPQTGEAFGCGRILGLDYGEKTVGVAISDPLRLTAQGLTTLRRERENALRKTLAALEEIIRRQHVELLVLGYPLNMNGTAGTRAEKTIAFQHKLKQRCGLDVILWDERLTTVEAERTLIEGRVRREKRGLHVDRLAAVFILQSYLDQLSREKGK